MKLQKVLGATSEIWQVFIQDSSSTTGAGLTGLAFNSASLTAYYHRDTDTTATAITLATMTVGTFTSSGFKEIDATNMPGWYQFCPPNAALASGAKSCAFHLKGATNMAPLPIEVQLVAVNPDSAATFTTGINGVAPPTNWNLEAIDASGRIDLGKILGTAVSSPATAGILDVNVKNMNNVAATAITTIKAVQGLTTADTISALANNTITAASINAAALTAAKFSLTCTEPTAVVAASPDWLAALSWLLTMSRNKITQTATTQILKADDGTTTVATSTISDDGTTFTRGKFA